MQTVKTLVEIEKVVQVNGGSQWWVLPAAAG